MSIRTLALALAVLVAAAVTTACEDGDDGAAPTPEPTTTATAEPNPTRTPTVTPTGQPTEAPTATPVTGTSTGIEAVDGVIDAVLGGDAVALAGAMATQQIECTEAQGAGGPPKCFNAPGEPAEGTPVEVFPYLTCELEWQFDSMAFAGRWLAAADELYAVVHLERPVLDDPLLPQGEYAVIFTGEGAQGLVLDGAGRIVMAVAMCGAEPAQFLEDGPPFHAPEVILRGPAFEE